MKAFWSNEYENSGKVLKYFNPVELYRVRILHIDKS